MDSYVIETVESLDELTDLLDDITKECGDDYVVSHTDGEYTVLRLPNIGDEISMTNGTDTLPCGSIAAIEDAGLTIVALNGTRFSLQYPDGSHHRTWTYRDRWTMVPGRVSKLSL
jgi:hypothetical protein